ncbi:uncharacterized protein J4E78_010801 [Alternaria triticimaculans]|uniref:uncharacterized protein n=2 Tax=Alternaria sect. Infectoriae TaxID=2499258 RepID=UPI0020C26CD5|nr:uncharacterized protein J4E78_010801 [Alternaria triticimaculans]KAI4639899.1 hypothetical protein J4E78_010801 [Alternaria triticimaculans]
MRFFAITTAGTLLFQSSTIMAATVDLQGTQDNARAALKDLMSQCGNGNLPGNAKRVSSNAYNGIVAYACNGFCRTGYMPCQDAEWSINRVINNCNFGKGMGWDSQETRGTWYGIAHDWDNPCGYGYTGRGATY